LIDYRLTPRDTIAVWLKDGPEKVKKYGLKLRLTPFNYMRFAA
jgi:hypothetical protein